MVFQKASTCHSLTKIIVAYYEERQELLQLPIDPSYRPLLEAISVNHVLLGYDVRTFVDDRPLPVQDYQSVVGKMVEVGFTIFADSDGGYLNFPVDHLKVF